MRLPRVRFTVRRLMLLMAIFGISLGVERGLARRAEYKRQSENYERLIDVLSYLREYGYLTCYYGLERFPRLYNSDTAPRHAKWVAYYNEMHRKYERAARYPWLPVEPDPPEPE